MQPRPSQVKTANGRGLGFFLEGVQHNVPAAEQRPASGVTVPSRPEASAIGIYLHAKAYLDAADALAREVDEGRLRLRFDTPVRHLYGQALENVLKSFLLTRGVTARTLRNKPFGHDLAALYAACLKHRMPLGRRGWANRRRTVALMNEGHGGPDFSDRYLKIGYARRPTIEACSSLCHSVSDAVRPYVHRGLRGH